MAGHEDEHLGGDEVLRSAFVETARQEVEAVTELTMRAARLVGLPERDDAPTRVEMHAAFERLIREDPEARALLERVRSFRQFRSNSRDTDTDR
jgi:hypothetical protein